MSAQTVSKGQKSIPEKLSWTSGDRLATPDRAHDLLDQWARERAADDDDLPARLDVDAALDEKACVLLDTWISHCSPLL